MKNIKKIFALFLCAAVILSAFSGCSGDDDKQNSGKKLVAGATTGFFGAESLDVANNWDGWIMSIYGISENLFRLDENFSPVAWIAESYSRLDSKTWQFKIRENVKFSNGGDVTAQAVKDCLDRTYLENSRAQSTLAVESIEADGQTLTITTPQENPTLLNSLCDPLFGIYDAQSEPDSVTGVSCTGPYMAVDFTAMTDVKMVKNQYYWGAEPKLDEVELKVMDDANALQMALQNGEIDMIAQLDARSADLFSDNDEYTVSAVTSSRSDFLMYNLNSFGTQDQAVREAIGYCIDRESFADTVYNGYAKACYGVYPDIFDFGSTQGISLGVSEYDISRAKQILKDAGYADTNSNGILDKDGKELSLRVVTYSYNSASTQLCDMLQASLSEVGIALEITTYDVPDDCLKSGDFDIAVLSYAMAPTGTADYFINMMFTTGATNNYGGYSNDLVDDCALSLSNEFDSQKRTELVKQICQEILNDRPFDFVANQQFICVYSSKVTGVQVNPSEYYLITADIDITEE